MNSPQLGREVSCNLAWAHAFALFAMPIHRTLILFISQVTAGRIKNGREYELLVAVNDGRHDDVQVAVMLNFVQFNSEALQESLVVRFHRTSAEEVLSFFNSINDGGGKLPDLLSLTKVDRMTTDEGAGDGEEETYDCLLALKDHDLVLPRSDAARHIRDYADGQVCLQYLAFNEMSVHIVRLTCF